MKPVVVKGFGFVAMNFLRQFVGRVILPLTLIVFILHLQTQLNPAYGQAPSEQEKATEIEETTLSEQGVLARAWNAGFVVFIVLLVLIGLSILSWAVAVTKYISLKKIYQSGDEFSKKFWKSRSLNELNSKLDENGYSPCREVFRTGYLELKSISIKETHPSQHAALVTVAMEALSRSLNKAKNAERHSLEKYLNILSISASVSPFIGLFGTVWGIMTAFEGIARTGSASLSTVAPGVSEALIATAFGLFAAIPAVVGYNLAVGKIRSLIGQAEAFSSDFLNVVQKHLMSDKAKSQTNESDQTVS